MKQYKNHPLAELFPLIDDGELEKLTFDIKENGLLSKITLLDDMILDGRNRYRACMAAGVDPQFRPHKGDPLTFVMSANLHRRHLTESQRAMVAAKISTLKHGGDRKSDQEVNLPLEAISRSEAAKKLNVSVSSVGHAKKVLEEAPKKDIEAVERGEKTVTGVLKEMKAKASEKEEAVGAVDKIDRPIPEGIREDWNKAEEVKHFLSHISKVRCAVKKYIDEDELSYRELTNTCLGDFDMCYSSLKLVLPYAVCPTCEGHHRKKCTLCLGRGFISEFRFKQCVPTEIKAILLKSKRK